MAPATVREFAVAHYDLAATLTSGQAFRWEQNAGSWTGVVRGRWVRLRAQDGRLRAETALPTEDWTWLTDYLQLDVDLEAVLETFPADEPMRVAVAACRGLRLLRQDPWECLASFILSSSKQILQIRQIVAQLSERYGEEVPVGPAEPRAWAFPTAAQVADLSEVELRDCKMGFRAPYLLATARTVAHSRLDLESLRGLPLETARAELMALPGVGRKIADCVLLFAYGCQQAFPVDVWVMKALRELYFSRRHRSLVRMQRFAATHFGPNAGYAQQDPFHYMRTRARNPAAAVEDSCR